MGTLSTEKEENGMEWIENLAREHGTGGWQTLADMVRFGKAVAAAEREACAKVCDTAAISLSACPKCVKNDAAISALKHQASVIRTQLGARSRSNLNRQKPADEKEMK